MERAAAATAVQKEAIRAHNGNDTPACAWRGTQGHALCDEARAGSRLSPGVTESCNVCVARQRIEHDPVDEMRT